MDSPALAQFHDDGTKFVVAAGAGGLLLTITPKTGAPTAHRLADRPALKEFLAAWFAAHTPTTPEGAYVGLDVVLWGRKTGYQCRVFRTRLDLVYDFCGADPSLPDIARAFEVPGESVLVSVVQADGFERLDRSRSLVEATPVFDKAGHFTHLGLHHVSRGQTVLVDDPDGLMAIAGFLGFDPKAQRQGLRLWDKIVLALCPNIAVARFLAGLTTGFFDDHRCRWFENTRPRLR